MDEPETKTISIGSFFGLQFTYWFNCSYNERSATSNGTPDGIPVTITWIQLWLFSCRTTVDSCTHCVFHSSAESLSSNAEAPTACVWWSRERQGLVLPLVLSPKFDRIPLTLSPPSSKSKSSQPFIEKCTSEVLRIGSIIMFHRHEWDMKSQVLHTEWCYISGEAAGEIWNSSLGIERVNHFTLKFKKYIFLDFLKSNL